MQFVSTVALELVKVRPVRMPAKRAAQSTALFRVLARAILRRRRRRVSTGLKQTHLNSEPNDMLI